MKNNINLVKGTHDLFGLDLEKYNYILENFKNICNQFSFKEIITPIIEQEELFVRGVGEMTDIVSKEMYTFIDQGEKKICLRPEATSGIARFAASNYKSGLMKLFTYGPMFRRERPQKGRYRQFNQLNIEIIGDESFYSDFEVIYIALHNFLTFTDRGPYGSVWVWWVASGSSQAIGHTYTNPWYDRNICVSALERAHSLGHILVL